MYDVRTIVVARTIVRLRNPMLKKCGADRFPRKKENVDVALVDTAKYCTVVPVAHMMIGRNGNLSSSSPVAQKREEEKTGKKIKEKDTLRPGNDR